MVSRHNIIVGSRGLPSGVSEWELAFPLFTVVDGKVGRGNIGNGVTSGILTFVSLWPSLQATYSDQICITLSQVCVLTAAKKGISWLL